MMKNADIQSSKCVIICIYDGKSFGLTDIMRGLVGIYKVCKSLELPFRVYITQPFKLNDYLLPSDYDWTITEEEYSLAAQDNCYLEFLNNSPNEVYSKISAESEKNNFLFILSNTIIAKNQEYGLLYDELFKPVHALREAIDYHLSMIGGDFISATFRFQQLLGDFRELDFPVLEAEEREVFIRKCLDHLREVHDENPGMKILATSDSRLFLAEAGKKGIAYIVPGNIYHPTDNQLKNDSNLSFMKSFLDYFLLKEAKKVYLVVDGLMYKSAFPSFAAMHGNAPFIIKNYNITAYNNTIKQLYNVIYRRTKISEDESVTLFNNALSLFRAPSWLVTRYNGLDVYNSFTDNHSKAFYKKLFIKYYVSSANRLRKYFVILFDLFRRKFLGQFCKKTFTTENCITFNNRDHHESIIVFDDDSSGALAGISNIDSGKYDNLYLFEPLKRFQKKVSSIITKKNLYKAKVIPNFLSRYNSASNTENKSYQAVSIDDFLNPEDNPTLIKININNKQLDVLRGAEKTIRRCKPLLAVNFFHKQDLIEITSCLLQYVPKYKFTLKKQPFSANIAVLYADITKNG